MVAADDNQYTNEVRLEWTEIGNTTQHKPRCAHNINRRRFVVGALATVA